MENVKTKASVVEYLLSKAAAAHDSADAMRFTQAACNAVNALGALKMLGAHAPLADEAA